MRAEHIWSCVHHVDVLNAAVIGNDNISVILRKSMFISTVLEKIKNANKASVSQGLSMKCMRAVITTTM